MNVRGNPSQSSKGFDRSRSRSESGLTSKRSSIARPGNTLDPSSSFSRKNSAGNEASTRPQLPKLALEKLNNNRGSYDFSTLDKVEEKPRPSGVTMLKDISAQSISLNKVDSFRFMKNCPGVEELCSVSSGKNTQVLSLERFHCNARKQSESRVEMKSKGPLKKASDNRKCVV